MRTWSEGESRPTRAFTITPEPDLPPEVWIDLAGDRLEVAPDQPLDLGWRARDDFGLLRVQVEIDGAAVGAPRARAGVRAAFDWPCGRYSRACRARLARQRCFLCSVGAAVAPVPHCRA